MRDIIAECNGGYKSVGMDIFTATERVEELWFEVEDLLEQMERAESLRDDDMMDRCLDLVYHKLERIQVQLPPEFQ